VRTLLVALIVASTVGFVVGTTVERNQGEERAETTQTTPRSEPERSVTEGSSEEQHADESAEGATEESAAGASEEGHVESSEESRPLGVDIEAVPFIVLAALGSLALAGLAWARPSWLPGLVAIAAAMTLFAALDVREVIHQVDESRTGLAVLAGIVAALHAAAGLVAALMIRVARHPAAEGPGTLAP